MSHVSLVLCIHNHQPVGNLQGVFEHAYRASYLPFLEAMERHAAVKFVVHNTGPLLEWMEEHEPAYIDRLGALAAEGRVELLTGGFYEPILPVIPERDARGQIARMTEYLSSRFNVDAKGMWVAERVWEPGLARVLAESGVEYVLLDDYEFRLAGLADEDLTSYFITEDQGVPLKVFPISQKLRYLIPFAEPSETISHLKELAERSPGAVAVFGDDGEKFGVWPGTHQHVYTNHWIDRFLDAIAANADWLSTVTFAEATAGAPPAGRVYLPTSSYPEMMEWALPTPARREYERFIERLKEDGTYDAWWTMVSGGTWRGFVAKYEETNFMVSKMRRVSAKVASEEAAARDAGALQGARDDLWRGQCNCAYWHGVFGGIYLPHLRSAIYEHLLRAENVVAPGPASGASVEVIDHDLDGYDEVLLESRQLNAYVAPARGGAVFEVDLRGAAWNAVATMARHCEAYHALLEEAAAVREQDGTVSIHDAVVAKEEGLAELAVGDIVPRVAAVDHFFPESSTLVDMLRPDELDLLPATGRRWGFVAREIGGIAEVVMETHVTLPSGDDAIECGVRKTVRNDGKSLSVDYRVSPNASSGLLFSSEWNIALLTGIAEYTILRTTNGETVSAEAAHSLEGVSALTVEDRLRGAQVTLTFEPATEVRIQPLQTASQSEGGFERVYQGLSFFPMWGFEPEAELVCSVTLTWRSLEE